MNLHALAAPYVDAVSPSVVGTWWISTGAVDQADFSTVPGYRAVHNVRMRVQALSGDELEHIDYLAIQGELRGVWMSAYREDIPNAISRTDGTGGDLLQFSGSWWKIVQVLEPWDQSHWAHVAVARQTGPPPSVGLTA